MTCEHEWSRYFVNTQYDGIELQEGVGIESFSICRLCRMVCWTEDGIFYVATLGTEVQK